MLAEVKPVGACCSSRRPHAEAGQKAISSPALRAPVCSFAAPAARRTGDKEQLGAANPIAEVLHHFFRTPRRGFYINNHLQTSFCTQFDLGNPALLGI